MSRVASYRFWGSFDWPNRYAHTLFECHRAEEAIDSLYGGLFSTVKHRTRPGLKTSRSGNLVSELSEFGEQVIDMFAQFPNSLTGDIQGRPLLRTQLVFDDFFEALAS